MPATEQYYDQNTRFFLRFGRNAGTGNIHQALWGPGVRTRAEAVNYPNRLILERIPTGDLPVAVLDLGCGVGASLTYLSRHYAGEGSFRGVTISARQVALAHRSLRKQNLRHRCRVDHASFEALPDDIGTVDLAFAIEAYVHAGSAEDFFSEVSRVLSPGGRLVIIDDFVVSPATSAATAALTDFRQGWQLGSLLSVAETRQTAARYDLHLEENTDLTPWLEKDRPRDRLIRLLVSWAGCWMRRSLYFNMLVGGNARQRCLRNGWITYRLLSFRKP